MQELHRLLIILIILQLCWHGLFNIGISLLKSPRRLTLTHALVICSLQEHVLTHYPDRPNIFTMKLNTLARFEKETERCASERKEERTAAFHFSGLLMNDEDSNETFEVSHVGLPAQMHTIYYFF